MALKTKIEIAARAHIVAYCGDISTMPGEPTHPTSEEMDIDENGIIKGLA